MVKKSFIFGLFVLVSVGCASESKIESESDSQPDSSSSCATSPVLTPVDEATETRLIDMALQNDSFKQISTNLVQTEGFRGLLESPFIAVRAECTLANGSLHAEYRVVSTANDDKGNATLQLATRTDLTDPTSEGFVIGKNTTRHVSVDQTTSQLVVNETPTPEMQSTTTGEASAAISGTCLAVLGGGGAILNSSRNAFKQKGEFDNVWKDIKKKWVAFAKHLNEANAKIDNEGKRSTSALWKILQPQYVSLSERVDKRTVNTDELTLFWRVINGVNEFFLARSSASPTQLSSEIVSNFGNTDTSIRAAFTDMSVEIVESPTFFQRIIPQRLIPTGKFSRVAVAGAIGATIGLGIAALFSLTPICDDYDY